MDNIVAIVAGKTATDAFVLNVKGFAEETFTDCTIDVRDGIKAMDIQDDAVMVIYPDADAEDGCGVYVLAPKV